MAECVERGSTWILHPDWLVYCRWTMCKCYESTFMVVPWPSGKPLPAPRIGAVAKSGVHKRSNDVTELVNEIHDDLDNGNNRKKMKTSVLSFAEPVTPTSNDSVTADSSCEFDGLAQLREESGVGGSFNVNQFVDLDEPDENTPASVGVAIGCSDNSDDMDDTGNEVVLLSTLSCGSLAPSESVDEDELEDSPDDEDGDDPCDDTCSENRLALLEDGMCEDNDIQSVDEELNQPRDSDTDDDDDGGSGGGSYRGLSKSLIDGGRGCSDDSDTDNDSQFEALMNR